MRTKFEAQLKKLNSELLIMGNMIQENIQKSIDALVNQDVDAARSIMEGDELIDEKQRLIESLCFTLLIQQQPVAKDLRAVTAAMKMVTDMERIGDHAADISEMIILMSDNKYHIKLDTIIKMASEAVYMLIQSINAFADKDEKTALEVIKHDDIVDRLFVEVKQELILLIAKDPQKGEQEIDLIMIAKYLERIGDHATNIAEWVLYSICSNIYE